MPRRPQDKIFLRMLGARIRRFREAKGWSQEELGLRAGCDRTAIQKYEAGATEPMSVALMDITRALELGPEEMLAGEVWERIDARFGSRQTPRS